jgi:hypothetical protein
MNLHQLRLLSIATLALVLLAGTLASIAGAEGLADDGGAEWRVEQPQPPPPPVGVEGSNTPVGLGRIGDIEFWAPNRGALITAGSGTVVPPGVWFYDGESWRELSTQCGASDGRIIWAGPDEFWTISDGRPGQAVAGGQLPPLKDNTLCRFAPPPGDPSGQLKIVASYASPAFLSTSYQAMHAGGCITSSDCWFAGEPLGSPQIGAFQLHWNGQSLSAEPFLPEGHAVWDMREFEGRLYEGLRLLAPCEGGNTSSCDRVTKVVRHPAALRTIDSEGAFEPVSELPLYGPSEFFDALNFLHLSAGGSSLWAAAGPEPETPAGSEAAGVTVIRKTEGSSNWSQLLGPETTPSGSARFPEDVVSTLAAEPSGEGAWLGLDSKQDSVSEQPNPDAPAVLARVSANGTVSDELSLPAAGEQYGPKGPADKLACPAVHDCWLATTQGWLLHLATEGERQLERLSDPVFSSSEPIVFRPLDQGVPQVPPDAPPVDDSGLEESVPPVGGSLKSAPANPFAMVTVPLLSGLRTRLVHRTTLELKFHLSVRARIRLLAERRKKVVASTPTRTLSAGNRSLQLHLDLRRWPTKLALQTHALAPLLQTSTRESGAATNSVSTSLAFPETAGLLGSVGLLGSGLRH